MKIFAWTMYIIAGTLAIYAAVLMLGFLILVGLVGGLGYLGVRSMRRVKARHAVPLIRQQTDTISPPREVHFE